MVWWGLKKPLALFKSVLCFAGLRPRDNKEDDYNQKEKWKHSLLPLGVSVELQSWQSSDWPSSSLLCWLPTMAFPPETIKWKEGLWNLWGGETGTTPAENNTTTEECKDTLPSPPRVFYSRHARTNCPVCQKDISSSYIDRHLRNMHRKQ